MAIDIQCPGCSATFPAPDQLMGKLVRCKRCEMQFRVGGELPTMDYDDEPLPPRRSASTALPWVVLGGILALCMVVGVVGFVVMIALEPMARPPAPVLAFQPQPQMPVIVPRRAFVRPNIVLPKYTIVPPRPEAAAAPSEPDTTVVNLSNLRQVEGLTPQDPTWLIDFAWQDGARKSGDRMRLVIKTPSGISENSIQLDDEKTRGSVSFRFFPGAIPTQGFELWIAQKTLSAGKWEYKCASNIVSNK